MIFTFTGKRIAALATAVPAHEVRFEDEIGNFNFSREKSLKLKKVMGFDRHRLVEGAVCASDLCLHAVEHLYAAGAVKPEEIGGLIFVSQTPDHFIPPTSNLLQARAGLGRDTFCLDINQGCAGFVVGLIQAFLMLQLAPIRKVLLLNGDTLSRRVCHRDRNIYPMVGDAGSAVVVESDPAGPPIHAFLQMDGTRGHALQVPAGGFRIPSTPETAVPVDVGDGNFRSQNDFFMDGPTVFNFVQTEVPPMVEALLAAAGRNRDSVEYFLLHQPNKFMLEKLASAMKIDKARVPNNIVESFGNASSVTIPTNIAFNLGPQLKERSIPVLLGGFGVGLTWAAMLMSLGPMPLCDLVEFE
ncbi:3-oxoacyl-(acyl-carrier-protein) synthase 3 [Candidatus Sulfopaludibacter sp. SbA3]|nr:3-oxoacyl-(acyl-carrier-protein) synthase 3 [Candidatus Sulfopaludibacter sp. SbA3]